MTHYTKFVGLDVHKDEIAVAIADNRNQEVRFYGNIPNTENALTSLSKKLQEDDCKLVFVYEAGPCGYAVHRHLSHAGYHCDVIAPSLIPKKAGDRVKTDRRDAQMLARLHRAGELTNVWVPGSEQEAMRDLSRLREDMKEQERHMKQRLSAFLLRNGLSRPEKIQPWSPRDKSWLKGLKFPEPIRQIVFQEYVDAVEDCEKRVAGAMAEMERSLSGYSLAPMVRALMGLRGVDITTAFTIVAELGDLSRFDTAPQMMAYLGLVPSEASSGNKTQRGGITKTGNGHVRRVLVESAWSYRYMARKTQPILLRQKGLSPDICAISWSAQKRLSHRYRHLSKGGKRKTVVVTAIARELAGFVWAIGCHIMGRPVEIPSFPEDTVKAG